MVSDEDIKYWVKAYCDEYNLSDKIEYLCEKLIKYKKNLKFIYSDWGMCILGKTKGFFGEKVLNVVAFYIHPDYRKSIKYFLNLQKMIKNVAKIEKVDYIIQGSHVNDKLNKYLEKTGWEIAELKWRV